MLRPSYAELMNVLNKETDDSNEITSRYTIVIASAKRARQIIDGDEPMVSKYKKGKPLSTAVQEIWESKIQIVPEGEGTVLHLKKKIEDDVLKDAEVEDEIEDIIEDIEEDNDDVLDFSEDEEE